MYFENSIFEFVNIDNNSNYYKLVMENHVNGEILIARFVDKSEDPFMIRVVLHPEVFLEELFACPSFVNVLGEVGIGILKERVKSERHLKYNTDGLTLLSDLSRRLYLGGHYFVTSARNAFDCIDISIKFIENEITDDIGNIKVLSSSNYYWSKWFYVGFETDSYFIFDNKAKTISMILIRDTD